MDVKPDFQEQRTRTGAPIKMEQVQLAVPAPADVQPLQPNYTLTDLVRRFVLFTPGVLYATTPFDRDALAEFEWQYPAAVPDAAISYLDLPEACFTGLGIRMLCGELIDFDRRLYLVDRARWPILRDTIAGIQMYQRELSFFSRVGYYEFPIVDHLRLQKTTIVTELPTVPVTVFAVSSTRSYAYIQPAKYPRLPYLRQEPARETIPNTVDVCYGVPRVKPSA